MKFTFQMKVPNFFSDNRGKFWNKIFKILRDKVQNYHNHFWGTEKGESETLTTWNS